MKRFLPLTIAMLSLVGGCSSDDDVATVETNVDKDKPVNELDEPEAEELCEDLSDFAEKFLNEDFFKRSLCVTAGIEAGVNDAGEVDEPACQSAFEACLSEPLPADSGFEPAGMLTCRLDDLAPGCDVTVGDLLACTEEGTLLFDTYINDFTCGKLLDPDNFDDLVLPPACEKVVLACPDESSPVPE